MEYNTFFLANLHPIPYESSSFTCSPQVITKYSLTTITHKTQLEDHSLCKTIIMWIWREWNGYEKNEPTKHDGVKQGSPKNRVGNLFFNYHQITKMIWNLSLLSPFLSPMQWKMAWIMICKKLDACKFW
jgi:hypothetical protein